MILKPGRLNARPNYLSLIETGEEPTNLEEGLVHAQLFTVHVVDTHFLDIIHFLTTGIALQGYTSQQKKELVVRMTKVLVIVSHLYKMGSDEIL